MAADVNRKGDLNAKADEHGLGRLTRVTVLTGIPLHYGDPESWQFLVAQVLRLLQPYRCAADQSGPPFTPQSLKRF
jgi:hypothetical protein